MHAWLQWCIGQTETQASMPHNFVETFGNRVAAIIDCLRFLLKGHPTFMQGHKHFHITSTATHLNT